MPSISSSHEISLRSKEGIGDFKVIEQLGGEEVHHHASGVEVPERELDGQLKSVRIGPRSNDFRKKIMPYLSEEDVS